MLYGPLAAERITPRVHYRRTRIGHGARTTLARSLVAYQARELAIGPTSQRCNGARLEATPPCRPGANTAARFTDA